MCGVLTFSTNSHLVLCVVLEKALDSAAWELVDDALVHFFVHKTIAQHDSQSISQQGRSAVPVAAWTAIAVEL